MVTPVLQTCFLAHSDMFAIMESTNAIDSAPFITDIKFRSLHQLQNHGMLDTQRKPDFRIALCQLWVLQEASSLVEKCREIALDRMQCP